MYRFAYLPFFLFLLLLIGCSNNGQNVVKPSENPYNTPVSADPNSGRDLIGIWNAEFDLDNMTVSVVPDRDAAAHFNITLLLPGPQIDIISFDGLTGIVEVDITIDNPSNIDGYDIRFIVMTDAAGHMLQNPDDWTDLYDQPGGLPINPFIAYNKLESNRIFAAYSDSTERMEVYLPAGNPNVTFAIDGSVPGNCGEPFMIDDFWQEDPLVAGTISSTYADVFVYDWQDNVNSVFLHCPVVTGIDLLSFIRDGADPDLYYATISNNNSVGEGLYDAYFVAYSSDGAGIAIYDRVQIEVEAPPPPAPIYNWTKVWGGEYYDYAEKIITDASGNLYITGYFSETVDFDPGSGQAIRVSNGDSDAFLMKMNINGALMWVQTWGGESTEEANGLVMDTSGNLYVTGRFYSTTDFDPGSGTAIRSPIGNYDSFLSKFDPNGNFIWVHTWGGLSYCYPYDMTMDGNNMIYVSGIFKDSVDFDPGPGVVERNTGGSYYHDAFVLKLNSVGNFMWVNTWGGPESETAITIEHYNSTELFISGMFRGEVDFDPGTGTDIQTGDLDRGLYASKWLCDDGGYQWTNVIVGDDVQTRGIDVDAQGDLYISGFWQDMEPVDFDPGPDEDLRTARESYDAFLAKYNNAGGYEWTLDWGTNPYEMNPVDTAYDVVVDSTGSIIVTGEFGGNGDLDPGPDELNVNCTGYSTLSGFNSSGDFLWGYVFGGESVHRGRKLHAHGNSIYVSGGFEYTADFDPGPGTDIKTANSYADIYLCKYDYM